MSSQKQAASQLVLSVRQVARLFARYKRDGPAGLVSRQRGQRNHVLPDGLRGQALSLVRTRYVDFGPTLAHEKLLELHGLRMSVETLRLRGICTMDEANAYLPEFMQDYNRRFARAARND